MTTLSKKLLTNFRNAPSTPYRRFSKFGLRFNVASLLRGARGINRFPTVHLVKTHFLLEDHQSEFSDILHRQNLLNFLQGVEVDRDRGVEVVDEAMAMCKNK